VVGILSEKKNFVESNVHFHHGHCIHQLVYGGKNLVSGGIERERRGTVATVPRF